MSMNSGNSLNRKKGSPLSKRESLTRARRSAKHGDFFFAKWATSDGYVRESPCLVVSNHPDPHGEIIVLKCTTQQAKTSFDAPVSCLKFPSVVRCNKIYTIERSQLAFPISASIDTNEYQDIMNKLAAALCL